MTATAVAGPKDEPDPLRVFNSTDYPAWLWIDGVLRAQAPAKSQVDVNLAPSTDNVNTANGHTIVIVSSPVDGHSIELNGLSLSSLADVTNVYWGSPPWTGLKPAPSAQATPPQDSVRQVAQERIKTQMESPPTKPLRFDATGFDARKFSDARSAVKGGLLFVKQDGRLRGINSVGMTLVQIDAGAFTTDDIPGPPGRTVSISEPFLLGLTEVTRAQWNLGRDGSWRQLKDSDLPMTSVTWIEANQWCQRLARSEELDYDLPTEAQWELACRGSSRGHLNVPGVNPRKIAWYAGVSGGHVHRVAQLLPNSWGLYDMHGNVREWCRDWWSFAPLAGVDPSGPARGTERSRRGGAYDTPLEWCGCGFRDSAPPDSAWEGYGFRVWMKLPVDR
jgi:formylglycine-generating enzyme required for sulfatase activity